MQGLSDCVDERGPAKNRSILKGRCRVRSRVGCRADSAIAVAGSAAAVMDVEKLGGGDEQGQQYAEQGKSF